MNTTRVKPFDLRPFFSGPAAGQVRVRIGPEDVVWTQGDPCDEFLYIETGWIKISSVQCSGREAVIAMRGAGDFIGSRGLFENRRRYGTATALTDGVLVRINRNGFRERLDKEPCLTRTLLAYLAHQHAWDLERLADQLTQTAEQRLARTLLHLKQEHLGNEILHRLSQGVLASMIGTTRPRVSHFMNKFRRQGFIDYDRGGHVRVREEMLEDLLAA
jgi:CRP/FNR family transcriptional regulator, cyclic AMP receptor protein